MPPHSVSFATKFTVFFLFSFAALRSVRTLGIEQAMFHRFFVRILFEIPFYIFRKGEMTLFNVHIDVIIIMFFSFLNFFVHRHTYIVG